MQVAGIRTVGARAELIEVGEPRPLAGDVVLRNWQAVADPLTSRYPVSPPRSLSAPTTCTPTLPANRLQSLPGGSTASSNIANPSGSS
jgi:hypothetical protein